MAMEEKEARTLIDKIKKEISQHETGLVKIHRKKAMMTRAYWDKKHPLHDEVNAAIKAAYEIENERAPKEEDASAKYLREKYSRPLREDETKELARMYGSNPLPDFISKENQEKIRGVQTEMKNEIATRTDRYLQRVQAEEEGNK